MYKGKYSNYIWDEYLVTAVMEMREIFLKPKNFNRFN